MTKIAAKMTMQQAQAFVRRVMGPPRRVLEGQEREHMLLMLALRKPDCNSNNQHSWSRAYQVGQQVFEITSFLADECQEIVEEILLQEPA